jgi:uncharacterized membrane protein YfcA
MSLVIAPAQAAGIVLPILCAMDVFSVWAYRRDSDRRTMAILAPGALLLLTGLKLLHDGLAG